MHEANAKNEKIKGGMYVFPGKNEDFGIDFQKNFFV